MCSLYYLSFFTCFVSLPLYIHPTFSSMHTATLTESHTQPEAFTDLFMHFSCTLVCLLLSVSYRESSKRTFTHTQTHRAGCWKPARIVDPLLAKGIEGCWQRLGDVLMLLVGFTDFPLTCGLTVIRTSHYVLVLS